MVDDALHPELDDDSFLLCLVDWVPGEAPLHVVVLGIPIKQGVLHLADQDLGTMLLLGNVLLGN